MISGSYVSAKSDSDSDVKMKEQSVDQLKMLDYLTISCMTPEEIAFEWAKKIVAWIKLNGRMPKLVIGAKHFMEKEKVYFIHLLKHY
jgi:hypothetical protein